MKETLNLLPIEVRAGAPEKKGKFNYLFLGVAGYSLIIIILWLSNLVQIRKINAEIIRLNKERAALQQKILPPVVVPAVPSIDKDILNAMGKAPKWSAIISDLSIIVPEEVWLSSIESKEEKGLRQMGIKGFSKTQLGVANLISAIESSEYFYDVEIVFAQKGEKEISFELKTKVRWT
ncbi:MAG: hypothetical protein FD156_2184 [Nitrospirae bacterium]|nr:MAG: hypothetical protein FD156_2184 [Nitrospirota bacterium]